MSDDQPEPPDPWELDGPQQDVTFSQAGPSPWPHPADGELPHSAARLRPFREQRAWDPREAWLSTPVVGAMRRYARDPWLAVPWGWVQTGGVLAALLREHQTCYRGVLLRAGQMLPSPPRPELAGPPTGHPLWDMVGHWMRTAAATCMACGVHDPAGFRGTLVQRIRQLTPTAPPDCPLRLCRGCSRLTTAEADPAGQGLTWTEVLTHQDPRGRRQDTPEAPPVWLDWL